MGDVALDFYSVCRQIQNFMKREGYIFDRQNGRVTANKSPWECIVAFVNLRSYINLAFGENVIKESLSRNA